MAWTGTVTGGVGATANPGPAGGVDTQPAHSRPLQTTKARVADRNVT